MELPLEDYKGLLVVGDVHSVFSDFATSYSYARKNNLFYLQLGDILDYGPKPLESLLLAKEIQDSGKGLVIQGNHDNKIYRYSLGNDVSVIHTMDKTVEALQDPEVADAWQQLYEKMTSHVVIGNTHITHAGFSAEYWSGAIDSKKTKKTYLYGETDKTKPFIERFGQMYPHRSYAWTGAIPKGKTVIVGHDRSPF